MGFVRSSYEPRRWKVAEPHRETEDLGRGPSFVRAVAARQSSPSRSCSASSAVDPCAWTHVSGFVDLPVSTSQARRPRARRASVKSSIDPVNGLPRAITIDPFGSFIASAGDDDVI